MGGRGADRLPYSAIKGHRMHRRLPLTLIEHWNAGGGEGWSHTVDLRAPRPGTHPCTTCTAVYGQSAEFNALMLMA